MKTKNASPARNVVLAALFLALAFVLPMVTGHLPQVGNMLCPMHFPILLCGFVLGGSVRLELPVLGLPVRCALHRCAGHHRTAGAHPSHHHRSAEGQGAGVTGSRCLYRKSRNWCSIQTTSFRYAIQRCCCCIKKLNCCHQASQSSLRSPVPLIGGASGKKRKFFSLSKPLLRRRGGIAKP